MKKQEFKWEQAYQKLRELIAGKHFQPNEKLPREELLCHELGVARGTLRTALAKLENEGYIERCHPGGTKVRQDQPRRLMVVLPNEFSGTSPGFYAYPFIKKCCSRLCFEMRTVQASQLKAGISEPESYAGVVILCGSLQGTEDMVQQLKKHDFPQIMLFADEDDCRKTGFAGVGFDAFHELQSAVTYLARSGHRRIAYLTLPTCRRPSGEQLKELFRQAGAPESIPFIREFDEYSRIREITGDLMELKVPPTAILCYNDHTAVEVYAELDARKLRIPEDVAVMNCFGVANGVLLIPELTYIDSSHQLMVQTAFDLLQRFREWKHLPVPPCLKVPCSIVVKASTMKRFYDL